ncbi:hypothetical protein, partial [Bacteroides fragilis]|uniref:hypothetical protein n=1 Tax=Bacteroides fragilis TaxID=817 RepID=UPI001E4401AA
SLFHFSVYHIAGILMFSQHNEHPKEKVRVLVFVFRKNKALLESQRVVFCACQPEKEGAK